MTTDEKTKRIAELNDLCRTAMGIAGRLVQTKGICALPPEDQSAIREQVERLRHVGAAADGGTAVGQRGKRSGPHGRVMLRRIPMRAR